MADLKISELTAAATLTGSEIVPVVQGGVTVRTTAQDIADLVSEQNLLNKYLKKGGAVWTGSGMVFDVTALDYFFNGHRSIAATQVTLDVGGATFDRIDAIVVDEAGTVSVIKGVEDGAVLVPIIPIDKLLIQTVTIRATETTPDIQEEDIYLDNNEWIGSTFNLPNTTGIGTTNFNGATSPKQGTKCIINSGINKNTILQLQRGSGSLNVADFDSLSFFVRINQAIPTGTRMLCGIGLNGQVYSGFVPFDMFGMRTNIIGSWQLVTIPLYISSIPVFNQVIFGTDNNVSAFSYDLDMIKLSKGTAQTTIANTITVHNDGQQVGQQAILNFKGAAVTVTNDDINKKIDIEVTGGSLFTKTKAEIDALIAGNDLVAGALYEITDVHPTLYDDGTTSGTTVYLRAISGSELEVQGMGKFYNPKYNQAVDGFGIWDKKMYGTLTSIVGTFDYANKEGVTANNGATGLMLAEGMIQWVSGDWSVATSIEGDVSGATASISDFVSPAYSVNDKVIWGGYSWTNLNGNVGASVDVLNLDSEWSKDTYDTVNYNIAYDLIEYDYANDMITRRYEKESNVDVKCSKSQYDLFVGYIGFTHHPISVQQFGNAFNFLMYRGQLNIYADNGYNECINFSGLYQTDITFGSGVSQTNLTFGNGSYQQYLTFGNNASQSNLTFGSGASQTNLTFGSGASQTNLTFGNSTYQTSLTFGNSSYQTSLTFGNSSYQTSLTFGNGSYQQYLTFGNGSYQTSLTFGNGSYQKNLNFVINASQNSITFGEQTQIDFNNQTISSNIEFVSFMTKSVTVPDLSTATYIYYGNIKEVYQRPDGALKIRFYDNSDVLQIVDIED